MNNKRKMIAFVALAVITDAGSVPLIANPSTSHIFIVLPLILTGIFLFFAGFYAGKSRPKNE